MKPLIGIHHITAITSSAEKNYDFFTTILGMRLVKKTINQDDIQTYHLFFADDRGNPGTDITFFDFPGIQKAQRGTNEIFRSGLRVPNDRALDYWVKRFDHYDIKHSGIYEQFGRKVIDFEDFDEQLYQLISDEKDTGVASGTAWQNGPVPTEFGITGLGRVHVRIADFDFYKQVLQNVLGFRETATDGSLHLFETGEGGNGAAMLVEHNTMLPQAGQGFGGVHHMAFRVEDRQHLEEWIERMHSFNFRTSGYVDRFYFESLYAVIANGILFEFATDEPGFIDDEESYEILGETLALPPKFRNNRQQIEKLVRHFDTTRSTKTFEKEYFGFE
ncbi:ring-cleaving dioxygenase [Jeotgalibaca sp. PTS2502]|uniref:VOC family protein n=1 Tax=Jeotgalibaca sp. PTS2502 TaxID=1903686 RepID=UPI0009736BE9|nr:VOC family protein [Jeotgalibaca sp. PTS2502]APZ49740.1 ring-cleaving dioxygenase [Jeotgalibaca sp. PTS2502]